MKKTEFGMWASHVLNKIYILWRQKRRIEDMTSKVYNKQIGGTHYRKMKIQPSKFVIENKLLFPEGSVIKYICRHPYKDGKQDLEKAKHFIDMIIERDYS